MASAATHSRTRAVGLASIAVSALILAACGGGGGGSTSVATKSSYASGRISGFGSIVVNGVHYKDELAQVQDEDGATHDRSELKLGMVVEVSANEIDDSTGVRTAAAQSIVYITLMRGPVESVGADSVVILGQTVKVTPVTVFDDSMAGGLATLKAGDVVEVHGMLDATTGAYTATRIEPEADAQSYRLRGIVGRYDSVTTTLRIGNAVIDVSTATVPDGGIQAGDPVRVRMQTAQVNGEWVATSVRSARFRPHDSDHSEIDGVITDFTSATAFSLDGLPVDASKATFPEGTDGIVKGARVEVEGSVVNGVLVATKVEPKSEMDDQSEGFEVDGTIDAVDTVKSTFVVRGVTVSYTGSPSFRGGTAADLSPGDRVEVHGALAADGVTVDATKIEFKP